MAKDDVEILDVGGREVRVTHPRKPYFTRGVKLSKVDIVKYFLSVAPGAIAGIRGRPIVLKRFVNGAEGEPFYQKRAPENLPEYLRTVTLSFPSGRTADEIVVDDSAGLAWVVNLGCIELHPHAVRESDLDRPDELRIDCDPVPGVPWTDVRRVTLEVKALLEDLGLRGWPKTSGSRGMHINVRIQQKWTAVLRRSPRASGGRKSDTASSSTTIRTPRIARRAPRIPCGRCRTRACPRRCRGTKCRIATPRISRC